MDASTPDKNLQYVGVARRVVAFVLDFIAIGGYILILLGVGMSLNAAPGGASWLASPLAMNVLSFSVLVLPVILYFSLQEGSAYQATWGKRRAKIKVVNARGTRVSLLQALLRSAIKFLPWQLAHMSITYIWFGKQSPIFFAGALAAQGLVGVYLLCLWLSKKHQTPYDWVARTFVILAD